jgi:hypothetical protein
MAIIFEKIETLDEVDSEGLYLSSFPDIDYNFFSQVSNVETDEEKKQFYFDQLQEAIDGTSGIQRPDETFLMFKGSIDGVDCVFNGGFVNSETKTYRGHWYLSRPIDGSRSWIVSAESAAIRANFFKSLDITSFVAPSHPSSLVLRSIRNNPNITVIRDETFETVGDAPNKVEIEISVE